MDLDHERFEDFAEDVDVVFDLVGGEILRRSAARVRDGGIVVSVVEDPMNQLLDAGRVSGLYFVVEPGRRQLEELARRADEGELRPVVGQVFNLADGAKAFDAKRGAGLPGKVVVRISDL